MWRRVTLSWSLWWRCLIAFHEHCGFMHIYEQKFRFNNSPVCSHLISGLMLVSMQRQDPDNELYTLYIKYKQNLREMTVAFWPSCCKAEIKNLNTTASVCINLSHWGFCWCQQFTHAPLLLDHHLSKCGVIGWTDQFVTLHLYVLNINSHQFPWNRLGI